MTTSLSSFGKTASGSRLMRLDSSSYHKGKLQKQKEKKNTNTHKKLTSSLSLTHHYPPPYPPSPPPSQYPSADRVQHPHRPRQGQILIAQGRPCIITAGARAMATSLSSARNQWLEIYHSINGQDRGGRAHAGSIMSERIIIGYRHEVISLNERSLGRARGNMQA